MTDERDAHLRAALRHAPDADVQPPPALSALILKEAQAKARDASTPARVPRHPLWSVWDWLARPSVATGFAGVMVATLVGLMWWDQPMDEAMPRPPVPAAARAPASAPASAPAATTPPPAAPMAEATRPAPEPAPAPQRKSAPVTQPAPAAAPAPEVAAREEAATPVAREAREAAPAAAADTATAGAPAMARAPSFEESKRQRSMASADTLNKAAKTAETREGEAHHKLAPLRTAVAAEPARWSWQRDGTPPQAINEAMLSWLARLDAVAGDRWQPLDASPPPAGREIRLLRDGHMAHGLRLIEGGVLWQLPRGRWQMVTLPPASLSALETSAP
ncbi:MAG: hypothetical protein H7Z15_13185 [Rhizobacter sp.]|nr:hypothetical protein [Rhizobacter sp.]